MSGRLLRPLPKMRTHIFWNQNAELEDFTPLLQTELWPEQNMEPLYITLQQIPAETDPTTAETTAEIQKSGEAAALPSSYVDPTVEINEVNFPDEIFRNCVKSYDLDRNGLLESGEAEKARIISLENREITSFKGIEYFTNLREFYCFCNKLTSLDVSSCTALTNLSCHCNQLTSLDLSHNTELTHFSATDHCRTIKAPDGTLALSSLNGFDPAKASNWSNGTVKNGVLTVKDPSKPVTYTYNCGMEQNAEFAIQLLTEIKTVPVYRLYNPYTGEHLLSNNETEKNTLIKGGWKLDGVAWNSVTEGTTVYRLYNPYDQSHLYSMNQQEIQNCLKLGWKMDGPVSHSATKENGIPIYRLFNPYVKAHYHLFSTSQAEINMLTRAGWKMEGIAWYAAK